MADAFPIPTGTRLKELGGMRFGRLVVLRRDSPVGAPVKWRCRCDCGSETSVISANLRRGLTASCGCLRNEATSQRRTLHGKRYTAEFECWAGMIQRCENPANPGYPYYGGRGITVCNDWRQSFSAFFADMGPRPSPLHSIDRIDNDGNYEPANCRWATKREQALNRRPRARALT